MCIRDRCPVIGHFGGGHVVYLYAVEDVTPARLAVRRRYIFVGHGGGEYPSRFDSRLQRRLPFVGQRGAVGVIQIRPIPYGHIALSKVCLLYTSRCV